jgi:hypothetical protein
MLFARRIRHVQYHAGVLRSAEMRRAGPKLSDHEMACLARSAVCEESVEPHFSSNYSNA